MIDWLEVFGGKPEAYMQPVRVTHLSLFQVRSTFRFLNETTNLEWAELSEIDWEQTYGV